ncbi:type II secretion system F family protein [Streptomyces sp. Da 82-17]|uniref:type II secretion system F family protein n=1 Tax=Streptomyces sp. Da 82-17 TaxID=3377116 RepID=UPI0038D46CCB
MVAVGGPIAPVYAAALCVGAAAWLSVGHDRELRRARLVLAGAAEQEPASEPPWEPWLARVRGRVGPEWWCLAVGLVLAVVGESLLPLAAGALGVPLLKRVLSGRRRRKEKEARADAVIALCGALAAEVRAGRQPGEAMPAAVRSMDGESGLGAAEAAVLAAARFGGDVPRALREASAEPGAEGLLGLAACWRVAVDQGGGLAAGLARLEGALRAERDQRADLRVRLSTARSTAVLLAGLPVVGLLMGTGLGADPLRVLLHTPAGNGCLMVGAALEGAGIWWAARIVRGAEGL